MDGRSLIRLLRIAVTAAAFSLVYAARRPFTREHAALFGRLLASCLEHCGPTFVKIGQILSSRHDLFERQTIAELSRLQDNVAPLPAVTVLEEVRRTAALTEAFVWIDDVPLASGSVAQVHRARTIDGREVVLKIRKPGIERVVDADIRAMRLMARLIERSGIARSVPVAQVVAEFAAAVRMQLDFHAEAEHYRRFAENLSHFEALAMPTVSRDESTSSVLVMEYVPDLTRVDQLHLTERERADAAVTGLHLLYHMIFVDGFVHADLHPGNIFFRSGSRIVLLDVGLVAGLDRRLQKAFVDFFYALVTGDGADAARVIWDTALWRDPKCDRTAFEARVKDIVARHSTLPAGEFEVSRFVVEVFDAQREARIRGTTSFMMTILSLLTYEGVVKMLSPGLDFQKEARHFLPAAKAMLYPRRPWAAS
jgi:ubiquinone biosynthesis protein